MLDHLIALGESMTEAEGGYWSVRRQTGNRYAAPGVVPEFWEISYYNRYPGPMTTPSGQYAGWQSRLNPGQLPPRNAPLYYAIGMASSGKPMYVPRPLNYYQPRMRPELWPYREGFGSLGGDTLAWLGRIPFPWFRQ
jgi:hypothetical protein